MDGCEGSAPHCESIVLRGSVQRFRQLTFTSSIDLQCATKNLIIHLEWEMGDELIEGPLSTASSTSSGAPTLSTNGPTTPRTRLASTLSAQKPGLSPSSTGQTSPRTRASSTFGAPSPGSLARPAAGLPRSSSFGKGLSSPRSATGRRPSTVSDFQGTMKRGPILSRPPKIISVVDTPEVSIGAVDPSKKRYEQEPVHLDL